jgi:enoyl-CoA hydratase/carnithine racemase
MATTPLVSAKRQSDDVVVDWPTKEFAVITLNRPARLNALTHHTVESLSEALLKVGATATCRCIILTGAGRAFCAGMDILSTLESDITRGSSSELMREQERFARIMRIIRDLRQPVIAAVNGVAAGAGMGLALAADLRVLSPAAEFHVAAVKIGLSAGECGISYHLPRYIGASLAFEYMLTGRPIGADDAVRIGLANQVTGDAVVVDAALALAREISKNSPFAVWQTKSVMWTNIDNSFNSAIELENHVQIVAVVSADAAEAMAAFSEKRPAVFTDR